MSLLVSKSANIVGGAPQGGYFNHLTVHGVLTLNEVELGGDAISSVAPAATVATKYLNFVVDGVAYKSGMRQNVIIL